MQSDPRLIVLARYAVALVLTGLAVGATVLLEPLIQTFTFSLFFAAVAVSAWYGGRGPGLLAAAAAAAAVHFFFLAPAGSFEVDGVGELVRLGVVLFVALLISTLSDSLRRSRSAAEDAERYVRGVLDSLGDPVIIYDSAWRYRYMNAAARETIRASGRSPERLLGRVLWDERPDLIGTAFEREIRNARASREPLTFEDFEPDGGRWYEITCYPLSGRDLTTVMRDVTDRKRDERRRSFMAEAGTLFGNELTITETLACLTWLSTLALADYAIAYTVEEKLHLRRIAVAHPDPERRNLLLDIEQVGPLHASQRVVRDAFISGDPLLFSPVRVEEIAIRPEQDRLARALAPRSAIVVPVFVQGRPIGLLVFATTEGGKPPLEAPDLDVMAEVAGRAGLAIYVGQARSAEHEARRQAESAAERTARLQSATASLARAATEGEVRAAMLEHARAGLGADTAAVLAVRSEGSVLELQETVNWDDETERRFASIPLSGPSLAEEALRTGEIVWAANREALAARDRRLADLSRAIGACAVMAVPLRASGEPLGVLVLGFEKAREFSGGDVDFMNALAQACGQALERARLYEAVRWSAEENARLYRAARRAVAARDEVLAFVSHDLRNSLVVVTGAVRRLLGSPLSAEKRTEVVARVAMAADQMERLIRDLLTVSQAEAGRLELERSGVDLEALAQEACGLAAEMAEDRGVAIECELEPDLPPARIDRGRMLDVLQNLLGNATKFTPTGGRIVLRIGREADDLRVEVSDTGKGIPADELPHIFDRFWHTRRSGRGAGLGLAICKGIIEAHGGRIWVESESGRGSTFAFLVPSAIEFRGAAEPATRWVGGAADPELH